MSFEPSEPLPQRSVIHFIFSLGNGVAIENVSSMMGHSKITMTQHYAKVLDSNVKKDMEKLRLKFT